MKRRNLNNRSFANMCARTTIKSIIRKSSNMGISYTPTRADIVAILERNRRYNKPVSRGTIPQHIIDSECAGTCPQQ